jgi:hypothetical protein
MLAMAMWQGLSIRLAKANSIRHFVYNAQKSYNFEKAMAHLLLDCACYGFVGAFANNPDNQCNMDCRACTMRPE